MLHLNSNITLFSEPHFLTKINFNNIKHSKAELIVLRVSIFTNNAQTHTCTELINLPNEKTSYDKLNFQIDEKPHLQLKSCQLLGHTEFISSY